MDGGSAKVGKILGELPEGLAPVADRGLPGTLHLGQGRAVRRVEEDGVVAESVLAFRLGRDLPLDRACRFESDAAAVRERNMRHETRRARGQLLVLQGLVDRRELGWIVLAMPPRRLHTRGAAERGDLDPRIIRDRGQAAVLVIVERLEPRILGERGARFFRFIDGGHIRKRHQLNAQAGEDSANLAELAHVRRRDEQRVHFPRCAPTIARCFSINCLIPSSASPISASSARRSKGSPSAVPCSSMKRPSPVFTKFMSTSAFESSSYARSSSAAPPTMPTLVAAT